MVYPPLDEADIRIIQKNLADDPEYLSRPECPYNEDTKSLFLKDSSTESGSTVNNIDKQVRMLNELAKQLEKQSKRFDNNELEPSEANAYFRQRVSISRDIVELQERLAHIGNVDAFYATLLEIMEDEMDADQRTNVISKLQAVIDKEA